jgi:hypothetical protein
MHIVLDAGPLIFLAKLDAFDVLPIASNVGYAPVPVVNEVARPDLRFRHPEIAVVERAMADGVLVVLSPGPGEVEAAREFSTQTAGLHAGELDVLALGRIRGWPVCVHERQASRLAATLGLATIHLVELLFAGTLDARLLERRVRGFARMTNLTMDDLDELLSLIPRDE